MAFRKKIPVVVIKVFIGNDDHPLSTSELTDIFDRGSY
jgi:hypothetical protein